ncbi:hypothetical protein ACGFYU_05160 [Streptomyces sp. NPDC048337]|uniref:hypothetical protein n=1 Tax=Streptomyces sp. NPDC048337 TaxID=3365535 RepID=UPI00371E202C
MDDFASSTLVAAVQRPLAADGLTAVAPEANRALLPFDAKRRFLDGDASSGIRVIDAVLPLVDTDMTRGRGRGKISPAQAARAVISGIRRDSAEIHIGRVKLLHTILRLSPALGHRILRTA